MKVSHHEIAPATTFDRSRATWALALLALCAGFAQFGAVASLADVAAHFGRVSASSSLVARVGLSGTTLGVGLAVLRIASLGALPLASLADRWGRRRVVAHSLWWGLAITAVAALSPNYWFFVACFALGRPMLSSASALVQVMAVELSSTATRVGRLAMVAGGAGAGAGLAAIVHGAIRSPGAFRWLFALALVPIVVVGPLLTWIPEPATRDRERLARVGRVAAEYRGSLWRVATMVGVLGMIGGPANGFVFVYGESVLHIAPSRVALLVSFAALTGLAGLWLSRSLARRWGRRVTVAIGVVAAGVTASVAYGGGVSLFVVGYLSGVAAAGLVTPVLTALSTEIFPHHVRATAAGWLVVAGVVGATAGLALFGAVGDAGHSTTTGLRVAALVTFLPLLWTVVFLRRLPESDHGDII